MLIDIKFYGMFIYCKYDNMSQVREDSYRVPNWILYDNKRQQACKLKISFLCTKSTVQFWHGWDDKTSKVISFTSHATFPWPPSDLACTVLASTRLHILQTPKNLEIKQTPSVGSDGHEMRSNCPPWKPMSAIMIVWIIENWSSFNTRDTIRRATPQNTSNLECKLM